MSGSRLQSDVIDSRPDLDHAATGEGVFPVLQPIFSLASRATVGFEALARWPQQRHLGPQSVLAHAAATNRVTKLDRLCIDLAVESAMRGGLTEGARSVRWRRSSIGIS